MLLIVVRELVVPRSMVVGAGAVVILVVVLVVHGLTVVEVNGWVWLGMPTDAYVSPNPTAGTGASEGRVRSQYSSSVSSMIGRFANESGLAHTTVSTLFSRS